MDENYISEVVFSKQVVEFVTVANEYCKLAESSNGSSTIEMLEKCRRILPLLYLKMILVPKVERLLEEDIEKFVTELEYNMIIQDWMQLLGEHDGFLEITEEGGQFSFDPVESSISECIADIYQDMKDFISAYSIGNEKIMNDALVVCLFNFEMYWGKKLVSVLKAIHNLLLKKGIFDDKESSISIENKLKSNRNWVDGYFDQVNEEE